MGYWKTSVFAFVPACLLIYAVSFGPAVRFMIKGTIGKKTLDTLYPSFLPPGWPRRVILPYAQLWSPFVPFKSWKPPFTEDEVRALLKPGTPRDAILQRFGRPNFVEHDPVSPDGDQRSDETLYYSFGSVGATYGQSVFSGFEVSLNDGKAVDWSSAYAE